MKKIATLLFFSLTLVASQKMLQATPFVQVIKKIGNGLPAFIELGAESCHSCQMMGKLLYEAKRNHPAYPIYFIDVRKERQAAYEFRIQMIPTQIVVDGKGDEVYRHVGAMKPQELENLLVKYFAARN